MADPVRVHSGTTVSTRLQPEAGDFLYGAFSLASERHIFERLPDGRFQRPWSLCQRTRFTHAVRPDQGVGWCRECVAALRDLLLATNRMLSIAGIRTDLPLERDDDHRGDHFVRPELER